MQAAGTGKSFLLQQFVVGALRNVEMCATTGIAALNRQQSIFQRTGIHIPAYTIYRWSGMPECICVYKDGDAMSSDDLVRVTRKAGDYFATFQEANRPVNSSDGVAA